MLGRELTLCSALSGVVTDAGVPVAGAEVERRYLWHWKDQSGTDRVTTDDAGRFRLPAVTASTLLGGLMPHQPLIDQTIVIRHDGRSFLAWELTKNTYEPNDELGAVALDVACDLRAEERYQLIDARFKLGFTGICRLRQD